MTIPFEDARGGAEKPPSHLLFRSAQEAFHQLPQTIVADPQLLSGWLGLYDTFYNREYASPEAMIEARALIEETPDIIASTLEHASLGPLDLTSEIRGGVKASLVSVFKSDSDLALYEIIIKLLNSNGQELGDPNSSVFVRSEAPPFIVPKEATVIDQLVDYRRHTYALESEGEDVSGRRIGRTRIFMEHVQNQGTPLDFLNDAECLAIVDLISKTTEGIMLAISSGIEPA